MLTVFRTITCLCLLLPACSLFAQWQNVAPNLLGTFAFRDDAEAAMIFKDGMLWAGRTVLWMSPDTGKTWQQSKAGFSGSILDINAYDRNTCVFSTNRGEIYRTNDGGTTWQLLTTLEGAIHTLTFFDDPRHIIAFIPSYYYVTHDGGATWSFKATYSETLESKWMGGGTIYFLLGNYTTKQGSLAISTDYGESWSTTPGTFDYDSYSFEISPCKGNVVVINEDQLDPYDKLSSIFRSTDTGTTWQNIEARDRSLDFFCGSISASRLALFAQTRISGIMRSTDEGATWASIGGPNGDFDTRLVAAVNSNIVFAVDYVDGSVYRTFNSGNDSLADDGQEPIPLSLSASMLFERDTIERCDSTRTLSLIIRHRECTAPVLKSETISGNAAADYVLLNGLPAILSGSDTIHIKFDPSTNGTRDALYKITLVDGRILRINLLGTGKGIDTVMASPASLDFDSLYVCDQPTLRTIYLSHIGCIGRRKQSETITGAQDFTIVASAPVSLGTNDFVRIAFSPTTSGVRTGRYVLTLTTGDTISIPLAGYGKDAENISLATADIEYDTLGSPISIPFAIYGLTSSKSVELVIHYDAKLEYLGSRSTTGVVLDIPGEQFPGRSKLYIPANQISSTGTTGYAMFNFIADTVFSPEVRFDSLSVLTGFSPCAQYASAISNILLPPGCDFEMIANFFYHRTPPTLTIVPNPTSGSFTLRSNRTLGGASIQLFDALGTLIFSQHATIDVEKPHSIALESIASGYHRLVITSTYGTVSKGIMLQK